MEPKPDKKKHYRMRRPIQRRAAGYQPLQGMISDWPHNGMNLQPQMQRPLPTQYDIISEDGSVQPPPILTPSKRRRSSILSSAGPTSRRSRRAA